MENRTSFKITVICVIIFFIFSCVKINNPTERNKLVFNDSIRSVKDSLITMNQILLKTGRKSSIYGIDADMNSINHNENDLFLYVDDSLHSAQKVGKITDSILYKSKLLRFIEPLNRKRFINLALYLNKNHLSTCYIQNEQPCYMYRSDIYMADRQTDLDRFVVFAKSKYEIDSIRYKILDSSNNLYLLANKDAKIWSGK